MIILYFILFKIKNYQQGGNFEIIPKVQTDIFNDCTNLVNKKFNGLGETVFYTESLCQEVNVVMKNCEFLNFAVRRSTNAVYNDTHFILVKGTNILIENSKFALLVINGSVICCEEGNGQLNLINSRITNCYIHKAYIKIVECNYRRANITNNFIYFISTVMSGRAFQFKYHTHNTFIGNVVENACYRINETEQNGCGVVYETRYATDTSIKFRDNVFRNCYGDNPSIISFRDVHNNLVITNLTIENSTNFMTKFSGYLMEVIPTVNNIKLTLDGCKFRFVESNVAMGGIGLRFARRGNTNLTLVNSIFEHISHTQDRTGGGVIFISDSYRIYDVVYGFSNLLYNLAVKNCTFYNVSTSKNGGVFYFDTVNYDIQISDSNFTKTWADDGHAIFINRTKSSATTISNCRFTDCNKNISGYVIVALSKKFNFLNNVITFSNVSKSCYCIQTNEINVHNFIGNTFENVRPSTDRWRSSVIHEIATISSAMITIENNTFDNILGDSQGRCFYIDCRSECSVILKNNTIQNLPSGGIYFKVLFEELVESFTIDSFRFINNTLNGFWQNWLDICPQVFIQNKFINKNDSRSLTEKIELTFLNCYFEGNSSPYSGGAIAYGNNIFTANTFICFSGCHFIENTAGINGGALSLQTFHGCLIINCVFIKNNAGKTDSGAIYISNDFNISHAYPVEGAEPEIIIDSCSFTGNCKKAFTSSILALGSVSKSALLIINCTFTDNTQDGYTLSLISNVKSAIIQNCTFQFIDGVGGGIFTNLSCITPIFDSINFISMKTRPALDINNFNDTVSVTNCIFDSCESYMVGYRTFSINLNSLNPSCIFENNVIKNTYVQDYRRDHIGKFYCKYDIDELILRNITFSNNTCFSLYGGGSGLLFINVKKLAFIDCKFINNAARKSNSSRIIETINNKQYPYYNGDGGGIQLGFVCISNDFSVSFQRCNFSHNRAERHGGAIALQTLRTVEIVNCIFDNNLANADFSDSASAELLYENHYYKKQEGRGGAIYINPAYTYQGESFAFCAHMDDSKYMTKVDILECNFTENSAYDGYAMYIEGDDPGTQFEIDKNNFIDNYNESNFDSDPNYINGAVISTEIHSIPYDETVAKNNFTNSNGNLRVEKILYVDHYGRTTKDFTSSMKFSPSNKFTSSCKFSSSNKFTSSDDFTLTSKFTFSRKFTASTEFSSSKEFAPTKKFTSSRSFTPSNSFTSSTTFTPTKKFTSSSNFSPSNGFTSSTTFAPTKKFTSSRSFTPSSGFSSSTGFTSSSGFSSSTGFTSSSGFTSSTGFTSSSGFTSSIGFTQSKKFTSSRRFSPSSGFSSSTGFTSSNGFTSTTAFIPSKKFTSSRSFTPSSGFTPSIDFVSSKRFTPSKTFTPSRKFTPSKFFTHTSEFTSTNGFTNSRHFTPSNGFTHSVAFTNSYDFTQSALFSSSFYFTGSNILSFESIFGSIGDSHDSSEVTSVMTQKYDFTKSDVFSSSDRFESQIMSDSETNFYEIGGQNTETESETVNGPGIPSLAHGSQSQTDGKNGEETISYSSTNSDHNLYQSALFNEPISPNKPKKKKNNTVIIVVVVCVVAVLLLASALTFAILYKKRHKEEEERESLSKETSPTNNVDNKVTQPETFIVQDKDDYDLNFWL